MENTENDLDSFEQDLKVLVESLKESFESSQARHYVDSLNEILYVELEGLEEYSEEEIDEIAGPLLEELDLDFEEIVLIPLAT